MADARGPEDRALAFAEEVRPDLTGAEIGERLRRLRKEMGWTLQQLAQRSGVSLSTLSKIENAQVAPTFDTLVKASRGLGLAFETILAQPSTDPVLGQRRGGGRQIVTRKDEAVGFSTAMYDYHVHANGMRRKSMAPLIMTLKARTLSATNTWSSHEGEEFVLVLKGRVELHTEFYEPVVLDTGDSVYFDSFMAHLLLNVGKGAATIASICFSGGPDAPGPMTGVPVPDLPQS